MYIPADKLVRVGSVSTRYWMEGEGSPVILLHGISNCIEDWLLNFKILAEKHRVYALDLIGHGKTDKPLSVSYTFPDFALFVKNFMDTLNIPCAHIIGHSLGGAVALTLARNFPDRVKTLVLVDSAGLAREYSIILRVLSILGVGELLGSYFLEGDYAKRLAFQRQSWPDPAVVPDEMIQKKYSATLWKDIRKTFFKALRANGNVWGMKKSAYLPIFEGLSCLEKPVLVVWGDQDNLIPASQAAIVKEKVPHARVEIFENCKHDPMVTDPERFNRLVLEFLEHVELDPRLSLGS